MLLSIFFWVTIGLSGVLDKSHRRRSELAQKKTE